MVRLDQEAPFLPEYKKQLSYVYIGMAPFAATYFVSTVTYFSFLTFLTLGIQIGTLVMYVSLIANY